VNLSPVIAIALYFGYLEQILVTAEITKIITEGLIHVQLTANLKLFLNFYDL
jgi:hypothetical protein